MQKAKKSLFGGDFFAFCLNCNQFRKEKGKNFVVFVVDERKGKEYNDMQSFF